MCTSTWGNKYCLLRAAVVLKQVNANLSRKKVRILKKDFIKEASSKGWNKIDIARGIKVGSFSVSNLEHMYNNTSYIVHLDHVGGTNLPKSIGTEIRKYKFPKVVRLRKNHMKELHVKGYFELNDSFIDGWDGKSLLFGGLMSKEYIYLVKKGVNLMDMDLTIDVPPYCNVVARIKGMCPKGKSLSELLKSSIAPPTTEDVWGLRVPAIGRRPVRRPTGINRYYTATFDGVNEVPEQQANGRTIGRANFVAHTAQAEATPPANFTITTEQPEAPTEYVPLDQPLGARWDGLNLNQPDEAFEEELVQDIEEMERELDNIAATVVMTPNDPE